jgi:hypothetical protein
LAPPEVFEQEKKKDPAQKQNPGDEAFLLLQEFLLQDRQSGKSVEYESWFFKNVFWKFLLQKGLSCAVAV